MSKTIVHHERAASLEVAGQQATARGSRIKLGLDIHSRVDVVVAQFDHTLPKRPQRFEPQEFIPWVDRPMRAGHTVHCSPIPSDPIPSRHLGRL
jgi:hypothetical protein